mmetsp:Transcript_15751/g.23673  ORF Transcript_15751/g.23673 Transcript_15751/m.23673 type:complete len:588 (-) Transcript_15751:65-1828(-)|eukprot:CAMPEP_0185028824 /NCGR_PEP_ID=MMETSP1103-20130426/14845_1 /TAXON_ID=36769 /ORGANISM="Paraphysomonas bandaiensis, Strain Caron Lab Isolate" /LENGTH=587 /DNA_ID=CAMNT_0027563367 /DNA_START=74 /DNA_END=1837 /DNA_ORIENTATION=+
MAELSHAPSPIESNVEALCKTILHKTSEFWEERNKAILDLTTLINHYEGAPQSKIHEVFNINVFRMFVEPVKQMILDLRSQQVRDTCTFLARLSIITKDLMRHFLREAFESIFIAVKVPNKVMSGYVNECIISLIRHTTFKSAIPLIIGDINNSRSKGVREHCMAYMNEILLCWELQEKEADHFQEAIRVSLEDASVKCRELSRLAYLNFRDLFPRRADRIKSDINNTSLRARLEKEEAIHDQERAAMEEVLPTTAGSEDGSSLRESMDDADAILASTQLNPKTAQLLKKSNHDDDAISSIQALIRGNLVRRQSSRYNVIETVDLPDASTLSPVKEDDSRRMSSLSTNSAPSSPTSGPSSRRLFSDAFPSPNGRSTSFDEGETAASLAAMKINGDENQDSSSAAAFKIGMVASVKGKDPPILGNVAFVGQTAFAGGYWVGLRLSSPAGKNDGSVQGTQYFKCPPLHGLFVRPGQLTVVSVGDSIGPENIPSSPTRITADTLRETLNLAHAVKAKLVSQMSLMQREMDLVEDFEARVQGDSSAAVQNHDCAYFCKMVVDLADESEELLKEFKDLLSTRIDRQNEAQLE